MIDSTVDKISFIRTLCSRFVKKSRINLHSIGDTFRVLSLLITNVNNQALVLAELKSINTDLT